MSIDAVATVQRFIEQPVQAAGAFATDLPTLNGASPVGFLSTKAAMPTRVLLAVTDAALHAVQPGIGWKARRLLASWNLEEVKAGRNGGRLVLTVPGFWVVVLSPFGPPARAVVELLCDRRSPTDVPVVQRAVPAAGEYGRPS